VVVSFCVTEGNLDPEKTHRDEGQIGPEQRLLTHVDKEKWEPSEKTNVEEIFSSNEKLDEDSVACKTIRDGALESGEKIQVFTSSSLDQQQTRINVSQINTRTGATVYMEKDVGNVNDTNLVQPKQNIAQKLVNEYPTNSGDDKSSLNSENSKTKEAQIDSKGKRKFHLFEEYQLFHTFAYSLCICIRFSFYQY